MKLIRPIDISETELDSSNVLLDDRDEWDSSVTYASGAEVMVTTTASGASEATFKIYRSTAGTNNEDPTERTTYLDGDETKFWWKEVSSVNRWKMFDQVIQDQTERAEEIVVVIKPDEIINSLALINMEASDVMIQIVADPEGLIYEESFNLVIDDDIGDWWSYFNAPIERDTNIARFELPGFSGAEITVKISSPGGIAKCGALVLGSQEIIGKPQYFASFGLRTHSRKITDEDFRAEIERRAFSDRQEVPVKIETRRLGAVKRIFSAVLDIPTVYVLDENNSATIIYGFYQDFDIIVPGPVVSDCSVEIEGLL